MYCRCHAVGSRSEITAACLVSLVSKILNEKYFTTNDVQTIENEESCKQLFLSADNCSCNIKVQPRLKPKQLFWGKNELIIRYYTYCCDNNNHFYIFFLF